MTADELDARLADLGLSEDGFARLTRTAVEQVRRWRSGSEPIPPWTPMVLALFSEFREGARNALDRSVTSTSPNGGTTEKAADEVAKPH